MRSGKRTPFVSFVFLAILAVISGIVAGTIALSTSSSMKEVILKVICGILLLNILIWILRGRYWLILSLIYFVAFLGILAVNGAASSGI